MATVSALIEETKRYLYSGYQEERNRLNGAINDTQTSITFQYDLKGITPGVILSVGLEEMRVWETAGLTAVVERGVNGSTPWAHDNLAVVTVKPKFSDFRIFQALNHDLRDLSSPINGLYQVLTTTVTYNAAVMGYDITPAASNTIIGIIDVSYDTPTPALNMPRIDSYSIRRNTTNENFPSGLALVFYEGGYSAYPIRITLAAAFGQWVSLVQSHTDVGLPDTAVDLPPLGAALRLVAPRDVKRSFSESQGEPRRAEEVAVGGAIQGMRGLLALRAERILAEAARLERYYPKMITGV